MTVYNKNGRWYYNFMIDGERYHKAIKGCTSHKDAVKAENILKASIMQNNFNFVEDTRKTTLKQAIQTYLDYSQANKKNYKNDLNYCKVFLEEWGEKTRLIDITPHKIEKFKIKRMEINSKSTVNRYLEVLSKIFNVAIANGIAKENPMKLVKKLKQENLKIRFLTKQEEQRLFKVLTENEAYHYLIPIIICALHTGMRRSEITNLKWQNVDFHTRHIELLETKSGKARKIPISSRLLNELKKLKAENSTSDYVFTNPKTGSNCLGMRKSFERALKKAEIKNFRFHDLRHTAATRMTEVGIDLAVVQEILGHQDIKTTMRYAHPVPERKLKAIEALNNYA